jgi:hypothetical protein
MRSLAVVLIFVAVLYAVDAHFFDGRYASGVEQMTSDILHHW